MNILKTKADKQEKYLKDVFKCAFEGNMSDVRFKFMVYEAKAIEACLVKLGELYKHIKEDNSIGDDIKTFIKECRRNLRNRTGHEVGRDPTKGYNPVTHETIEQYATIAIEFLKDFKPK
jgi:hypothetical protein